MTKEEYIKRKNGFLREIRHLNDRIRATDNEYINSNAKCRVGDNKVLKDGSKVRVFDIRPCINGDIEYGYKRIMREGKLSHFQKYTIDYSVFMKD